MKMYKISNDLDVPTHFFLASDVSQCEGLKLNLQAHTLWLIEQYNKQESRESRASKVQKSYNRVI